MEEKVKPITSTLKENKKEDTSGKKKLGLDLAELKSLFQLLKECNIDEFELKKPGLKIRIKQEYLSKNIDKIVANDPTPQVISRIIPRITTTVEKSSLPVTSQQAEEKTENLHYILSPMVGTFYRAPNPDAEPFVDVNQEVKQGQVIGIIEAMKIMNEIESDVAGEIVAIYIGNGEPVEFGQKLMACRIKI